MIVLRTLQTAQEIVATAEEESEASDARMMEIEREFKEKAKEIVATAKEECDAKLMEVQEEFIEEAERLMGFKLSDPEP